MTNSEQSTTVTPVSKIASFRARPGRASELGAALRGLVEPSRGELECLRYEVYVAADDDAHWAVVEKWGSPEAFDRHMRSPHLCAFLGVAADLCGTDIVIQSYREA